MFYNYVLVPVPETFHSVVLDVNFHCTPYAFYIMVKLNILKKYNLIIVLKKLYKQIHVSFRQSVLNIKKCCTVITILSSASCKNFNVALYKYITSQIMEYLLIMERVQFLVKAKYFASYIFRIRPTFRFFAVYITSRLLALDI